MTKHQKLIQENFAKLHPQFDLPLAPTTYMKIGGPAEIFFELEKVAHILEVVTVCRQQKIPVTILGGASNVIVSDTGLRGVVISPNNTEYEREGNVVRAGAGWKTALLVRKTVDDGLTGLEYFLGVPGKLGGSIYNNAHYLSDLIGQYVQRVQIITSENKLQWLTQAECQFAYDYSLFHKTKDVIVQVEFQLSPGKVEDSKQMIKEATLYRAQTQPLGEPSSGCYFRNAVNTSNLQQQFPQFAERREIPAGFLIDKAGLKGQKVGGVEVSHKHAAFFINTGHGTSKDVQQLADTVKQHIKAQFGVELQEEVFFLEN